MNLAQGWLLAHRATSSSYCLKMFLVNGNASKIAKDCFFRLALSHVPATHSQDFRSQAGTSGISICPFPVFFRTTKNQVITTKNQEFSLKQLKIHYSGLCSTASGLCIISLVSNKQNRSEQYVFSSSTTKNSPENADFIPKRNFCN